MKDKIHNIAYDKDCLLSRTAINVKGELVCLKIASLMKNLMADLQNHNLSGYLKKTENN